MPDQDSNATLACSASGVMNEFIRCIHSSTQTCLCFPSSWHDLNLTLNIRSNPSHDDGIYRSRTLSCAPHARLPLFFSLYPGSRVQLQACAAELKNNEQTLGRSRSQQPPNSEMMVSPHQWACTLMTGRLFSGRRRRAQTMMGQSPPKPVV